MTYAAALERQAYSLAAEIAQHDLEQLQHMPEQHIAAAALLKRAAGVYEYAAEELIDQLTGPKQADRYLYHCPANSFQVTPVRSTASRFA